MYCAISGSTVGRVEPETPPKTPVLEDLVSSLSGMINRMKEIVNAEISSFHLELVS